MKNKEYYKDQIFELICNEYTFAVNSETNKLCACKYVDCDKCAFHQTAPMCRKAFKEWLEQEHEEPILNDAERQYLEAVITPFKDRARSVTKYKFQNDYIWLYIDVAGAIESTSDSFSLPAFPKDSAYLGMKFDKEYTLEELRLFEDENGAASEKDGPNDGELKPMKRKIEKIIIHRTAL